MLLAAHLLAPLLYPQVQKPRQGRQLWLAQLYQKSSSLPKNLWGLRM